MVRTAKSAPYLGNVGLEMMGGNKTAGIGACLALATGVLAGAPMARAADMTTPVKAVAPVSEPSPWFVRVGVGGLFFDSSTNILLGNAPVPFSDATADNNWTVVFDIGYYITPNISLSLTGGYPPTTTLTGQGSLAALGALGKTTYGPAALTAQYHFNQFGAFQPYVGAGIAYAIIFNSNDGAVKNLKVNGAPAFVLQAGAEYAIDQHWGVFADVKKLFLEVDATGIVAGLPVQADITLDPLIVSFGASYRF
ncbi:OmpW family protein (plasmid) [Xanthobacter versatilis]|uniref:OmpW family protein n=1 Tax=Xanthobacter autotrophicus (strain ATCC BAA-1158 / Py2) TaxID=78245 RepID=A7IPZ0_XANP2|nr:OmpW family protein [Xanthobacter autotrophicus Py2]